MSLHTGESLYKCNFCDKTFKSNANMYSHRKKMHYAEMQQQEKLGRIELIDMVDNQ